MSKNNEGRRVEGKRKISYTSGWHHQTEAQSSTSPSSRSGFSVASPSSLSLFISPSSLSSLCPSSLLTGAAAAPPFLSSTLILFLSNSSRSSSCLPLFSGGRGLRAGEYALCLVFVVSGPFSGVVTYLGRSSPRRGLFLSPSAIS